MKNPSFRGDGVTKNQYRGGGVLKKGGVVSSVCRFKWGRGGLGKNKGVLFLRGWGVDTQMHTM